MQSNGYPLSRVRMILDKMPNRFALRDFVKVYQAAYGHKGSNGQVNWPGLIASRLVEAGCAPVPVKGRKTAGLDLVIKKQPANADQKPANVQPAPVLDEAETLEREIRELEEAIKRRQEQRRVIALRARVAELRQQLALFNEPATATQ